MIHSPQIHEATAQMQKQMEKDRPIGSIPNQHQCLMNALEELRDSIVSLERDIAPALRTCGQQSASFSREVPAGAVTATSAPTPVDTASELASAIQARVTEVSILHKFVVQLRARVEL
jgi:hypothetical protein